MTDQSHPWKTSRLWLVGIGGVLAASLVAYATTALAPSQLSIPANRYFFTELLPFALLHLFCLFCVRILSGPSNRNVIMFWGASAVAILIAGGLPAILSFLGLLVFGAALTVIGGSIAAWIFAEDQRGLGLSLGLGIIFASILGSLLSAVHLFVLWIVVPGLVVCLTVSTRGRWRAFPSRVLSRASALFSAVMPASVLIAIEGMFLLAVFVWVGASPPEIRSDALRVYLPYVRLLEHFHGFFDMPSQVAFIMPQAGVTYAGLISLVLGPRALRYAMPLALCSVVGIICARARNNRASLGMATALVVASCPLILIMTVSLMQEAFVSLAVLVLGFVCLEGRLTPSYRYWIAVGVLAGTACMAKYTTIVYVAPCVLWGVWRSARESGLGRTLRGLTAAGAAALAASAPWLWNAYRQSGDPLFPFFLRIFHSPMWPKPLGKGNLDNFRLSPGPLGWMSWPYDMIVHTNRFVEGAPGYLGITLSVLLVVAIPFIFRLRSRRSGAWVLCAAAGTALLWTQTAYLRYWIPALWLLAPAAVEAGVLLARSEMSRRVVSVGAMSIMALQIPVEMKTAWRGWPWQYYSGTIDDEFFKHLYAGYGALRELARIDPGWPRVWFTGFVPVGYVPVIPLEAAVWHFHLRGVADSEPEAMIRFLNSAGCDYWIVNRNETVGYSFKTIGVAAHFWTAGNLVSMDGPIEIYRMPLSRRAADAVASFRRRSHPARTDLLRNGGFEEAAGSRPIDWVELGPAKRIQSRGLAKEGNSFVRVGSGATLWQPVRLPKGMRDYLLTEWVRTGETGRYLPFRLQVNWLNSAGGILDFSIAPVYPEEDWKKYQVILFAPAGAGQALVYLTNQDPRATTDFDDVHFYSVRNQ
jgi:hypothetical protein